MTHVQVRGLTRGFAGGRGIRDVSFDARPGRVTGLIGPNGSGKTTTLRSMVGLVRASGVVTYDGLPYAEAVHRPGGVGVQLDMSAAHPQRTARHHLAVLGRGRGVPPARVAAMLDTVGLAQVADRRVGTFSMGMRQRLGLAGALLRDPRVVLLDEPTNGLDPHGVRWLRDCLAHAASEGAAVLVSSHALGDLEQVVDDLVILSAGEVRTVGSLEEVVRRFGHLRVHLRVDQHDDGAHDRVRHALDRLGAHVGHRADGLLVVSGLDVAVVGRAAHAAGAVVLELSQHTGDLHEAYLAACEVAS